MVLSIKLTLYSSQHGLTVMQPLPGLSQCLLALFALYGTSAIFGEVKTIGYPSEYSLGEVSIQNGICGINTGMMAMG